MSEGGRPAPPRTVSDLMRRHVVTIGPDASVQELARLLRAHGISGVPVVDESGMAVGTVSITDLLWLGDRMLPVPVRLPQGRRWEGLEGKTVRDVMSTDVYGLEPDAELEDLLEFFSNTGLRRAFILEQGRVVGVVSTRDLLDLLIGDEAEEEPGRSDSP